ncbi:sensor domain-containing protein [Solidesulfovibrio magneticus]|uniref:Signaling protein n=1 Tax=Solidesulfovibrio magneticus (strain ATCC 700980 / DSM 13731 / RS-1) TaxID=573370 RepID=C4XM09_SOLM1|nr:bifunctional diguanylate cyclase/phosphodiesterase [Solidesulfovibrio magneticus]BAH77137.1 putative signaling protein [Solidesulfovibrio magneticus RS-1]
MLSLKPSRIVAIYAVVSALWILFSDRAVGILFSNSISTITLLSTFKGWLYIGIVSIILYAFLKKYERENIEQQKILFESEKRFRTIFDSASDCIFIHDAKTGKIVDVNSRTCKVFRYAREEILALDVGKISSGIYPYTQEEAVNKIHQTLNGDMLSFEWQCKTKDGQVFWGQVCTSVATINGDVQVIVNLQDISEHKRAEHILIEERKFTNAVLESVPGLLYLYNDEGLLIRWNKQHETITGYSGQELAQMHLLDWYKGDELTQKKITSAINRVVKDGSATEEADLQTKTGARIPFYFTAVSLEIEGKLYFVGTGIDITEQKKLEQQLLFRALHDPLTGLANRVLCMDRISQASERLSRNPNHEFAVVFIDLNNFKSINDSFGHEAGDQVLCEVANRIHGCARKTDTVCRYGGDEFIILLTEINKPDTIEAIHRIQCVLKTYFVVNTHILQISASYGIAYGENEKQSPEDLLRNANIALHNAKNSPSEKIIVFENGMHELAMRNLSLQNDMRRGLEAHEFFIVYQPIFFLSTGELYGFEALLRWSHPQRGIVSPGEFIPAAEESGFIYELGNFALTKACNDFAKLLKTSPKDNEITLSVNISTKQLAKDNLIDIIEYAIGKSGLPPGLLILEITESSIMEYPDKSAKIIDAIKSKGIGIAVDDFGTGYSSMSVLQKLKLDKLKIDMSFVNRLTESSEDCEIVRAIITLSNSLHLQTVAEGIETSEQLQILRSLGCELGQGYLCSKPLDVKDLPLLITQNACPSLL